MPYIVLKTVIQNCSTNSRFLRNGFEHPIQVAVEDSFEDAVIMAHLLAQDHARHIFVHEVKECGDLKGVTGSTLWTSNNTQVFYTARRDPIVE